MIVGVLGAGQLGRMLGLAGLPLGLKFRFFDSAPDAPAKDVGELVVGSYDDVRALARFADGLSVATCEFENVPADALRAVAGFGIPVRPGPKSFEVSQDRLAEKTMFKALGIPTTAFEPVESRKDLDRALARIGLPAVLKTRRLGYDGKGQAVIRHPGDVGRAWEALGGRSLLLETFIQFDRELSILAVRGGHNELAYYPLVENRHQAGILRVSTAPAQVSKALETAARRFARKIIERLGHMGLLTLELFERNGRLYANELAPRVHNSGHWTIEGAATSQFENHLRAVIGLPLGSTEPRGFSAMINLLGTIPSRTALLALEGVRLHDYAKAPRAGRKLGHVTFTEPSRVALAKRLSTFAKAFPNQYNGET